MINCNIPAINIPIANAMAGELKNLFNTTREQTIERFKIIGKAATIANLPIVFNIPDNKAMIDIKNK